VDPSTGWVAVSWYDARNAVNNDGAEVFATVSVDAHGLNFLANVQVAGGPSRPVAINEFDDYYSTFGSNTGLAFYGGTFYPIWADNSTVLPNPDRPHFDIAVAAVTAPWSSRVRSHVVTPPGNPDPLSMILASEIYVLLHTPDPPPLALNQAGVLTAQIRAQSSLPASLAVDILFARQGARGASQMMGGLRRTGAGGQLSLLDTGLGVLTSGRAGLP
jgi:hypothetical protein